MSKAQAYAKEAIAVLKGGDMNPFDELSRISALNELTICRGSYHAWEVLELMIMVDWFLQNERTEDGKQ